MPGYDKNAPNDCSDVISTAYTNALKNTLCPFCNVPVILSDMSFMTRKQIEGPAELTLLCKCSVVRFIAQFMPDISVVLNVSECRKREK
jgi:hypothetical protein